MLHKSASRGAKNEIWPPGLTGSQGTFKLLPDTLKDIAGGDAATVTFIDHGPQGGKLYLVSLFLALQTPERGADYFTGVLEAPAFHLRPHKVVKLVGQVHITDRHSSPYYYSYPGSFTSIPAIPSINVTIAE